MALVQSGVPPSPPVVYIPHHAVIRETSSTTRLRVVFNASHKSSNGLSLNYHLMVGPKLQQDIAAVLMRWRQYCYVYTANIEKMYRQIKMDEADTDYQRILWKGPTDDLVKEYRLLTITYGTACAPYLALRVLHQLAHDEGSRFPVAKPVLTDNLYVDDCVFGADDKPLALHTRDQLIQLLSKAGFHLRKWASNCPTLLEGIDPIDHGFASDKLFANDENLKILGISWNPTSDSFTFHVCISPCTSVTKRNILSAIAKMYDPLGWVTSVIITAKIFMQQLWLQNYTWDEPLPLTLSKKWTQYCAEFSLLPNVTIPRWVGRGSATMHCELHGFSGASTSAYGATVYLRSCTFEGTVQSSLLVAKSKVATLKPISIPRLELTAALLLARCLKFVQKSLSIGHIPCHCWMDSSVTLTWIQHHPSRWKSFVANRVYAIQAQLPNATWQYVPSASNPADLASRGGPVSGLASSTLWWKGPEWLLLSSDQWPIDRSSPPQNVSLEERSPASHHVTIHPIWDLAERYSSWPKLLRITAYLMRFIARLRATRQQHPVKELHPPATALSVKEINHARIYWLQEIQGQLFAAEQSQLRNNLPLSKRSHVVALNPFINEDGLLRVGGRLRHAELPEKTKHPIIIGSHFLVKLIIQHTHLRSLHSGPTLTLHLIREDYWLLRARQVIRAVLHACVTCARHKAETATELMGDLPDFRVRPSLRAFIHCGVDYAGPLLIRNPGRGHKSHKAYVALFICMGTRALHLELVSECTTAAFLATYSRFCARRGIPSVMYSDNGKNCRGAQRELEKAWRETESDPNVLNKLAEDGVTWRFLPPSAPHFGGLWESAVRSVKYHLKRTIGSHTLTFEEMTTFFCRIEACLNSRSIAQTSDQIDDYSALTPGHFLLGSAINAIPEPTLIDEQDSRLLGGNC